MFGINNKVIKSKPENIITALVKIQGVSVAQKLHVGLVVQPKKNTINPESKRPQW